MGGGVLLPVAAAPIAPLLQLQNSHLSEIFREPYPLVRINQNINPNERKTCAENIDAVPIVGWFFSHHTLVNREHSLLWIWII